IEFADDLAAARYAGAEGVGLYRSEFLLAVGTPGGIDPADENQQYEVYRAMLEGMAPGPVTVRTFDVDEDQLASRASEPPIGGGWRGRSRGRRRGAPRAGGGGGGGRPGGPPARAPRGARPPRPPAHHVSVRVERRADPPGAPDDRGSRHRARAARRDRARCAD